MDHRLKGHIPSLDGVRGAAVLLVLLFHTTREEPETPIEFIATAVRDFGWAGVDLFFVLSGFLITGILLDARGKESYFRSFFIRRSLRIFPLYFAVCSVLFLLVPAVVGYGSQQGQMLLNAAPWYFAYALNIQFAQAGSWAPAVFGPLTVMFWSLCVEEQFYLVWPFVVYWSDRKTLITIAAAMIGLALPIRLAAVLVADNYYAAYVLLPARMDALAVGALVACLVRGPIGLDGLRRPAIWGFTVAGVAIASIVGVMGYANWDSLAMATIGISMVAVGSGALLVLVLSAPGSSLLARVMSAEPLRFFGRYSYGMYIFGAAGAYLVKLIPSSDLSGVPGLSLTSRLAITFAADVLVTTCLAMISWHILERPFLSLKDRFRYDSAKARVATSPESLLTPATVLVDQTGQPRGRLP